MANIIISSQQETTIDYPGKMAIIVFCPGCNFRCGFCHNPELVMEQSEGIDVEILLKNIQNRKNAGWYNGVCISGGEPTLQLGLIDFCKRLKEIGLSVKLDTNGTSPSVLQELIDLNLVDYIAMDIKSIRDRYNYVAGIDVIIDDIEKSIKLIREFPVYEFRTTILPLFDEDDVEEIGKWISQNGKNKVKLFTLQQFNPKNTLDSEFMKMAPLTKEDIVRFSEVMKKYADEVRVLA